MKILYAAGNNENAKIQLSRFIQAMDGTAHTVKVAAYKKSSPNINIDWTLDCLLNIFKPEHISLDNDNFTTYFDQVRYYKPDLIISDLEFFTSHVANILGTTLWQCSSSMVNFALENEYKYNLGVFKGYAYLFSKNPQHIQRLINIMDNSSRNLLYSHFGDTGTPPKIKPGFEWVQPYHQIGKISKPCQHNVVAGTLNSNKRIIELLAPYSDSVCFSDFYHETYRNPIIKDIRTQEEYFCNLKNSNLFVSAGQTSFLADAFYNGKYSAVLVSTEDPECIVNSAISEKLGLSKSIYRTSEDLNSLFDNHIETPIIRSKFLHEKINELDI